jgi:hypothetical protein
MRRRRLCTDGREHDHNDEWYDEREDASGNGPALQQHESLKPQTRQMAALLPLMALIEAPH